MRYDELEQELLNAIAAPALSEARFQELALAVCAFQRAENPPYARFCAHLGTPARLEDWREIPALPLEAFREAEIRSFAETPAAIFQTSGTTGSKPGRHALRNLTLYDAAILRAWQLRNFPGRRQIILMPETAPHSSLGHMMHVLPATEKWFAIREGGLDFAGLDMRLREPVMLLGPALAFLRLFEEWPRPFPLAPGSWALETGGYKGSGRSLTKAELYAQFGSVLGLAPNAIVNEYGMTELSSQFYTRGLGQPHWAPPWTRAVVIDPETGAEATDGATGVLKIIDLANLGSVIALQTRDLAVRRGDAFELIGRDPAALPRGCSLTALP